MKKLILIYAFSIGTYCNAQSRFVFPKEVVDSLNKLKVSSDFIPTRYKAGFAYYDNRGIKITLLKWTYVGDWLGIKTYRWRIKCEWRGITALAWTDDWWIDVYTNKAYLNERTNKIIYYDSSEVFK